MIWHTNITGIQFFGYAIALGGLLIYSETIKYEHVAGFVSWAKATWESPSLDESRLSPLVRRAILAGLALLVVCMLVVGFSWTDDANAAGTAAISGR